MSRALRPKLSRDDRRRLREEYLLCRVIGHQWEEFTPIGMRRPHFGYRLSLRCSRCTTERHELINSRGEVGSRSYVYPDDYDIPGRAVRTDLRVEVVRRRRSEPLRAAGR